ncbi:MAG: hypothetical protein PHV11_05485 [Candidatus Bipolaricaulis sp.]|jgi:hypothetical protein|nr:hypothetical protein [Candidatus Bipolaricaulis sp.]
MIALDWDGVLIDHPPNISWEEILTYPPMEGAVKVINYMSRNGADFYVLTSRDDDKLLDIRLWMEKHGFPPMEVTNKKKHASLYIDDRAVRFTNWEDISKLIM